MIGVGAGLLAGLLGIGGGLVVVPALAFYLQWQGLDAATALRSAIATSLATVLITALASTWAHHRVRAIEWPRFRAMAGGLATGAAAGGVFIHLLPGQLLRLVFGTFAILMAAYMASGRGSGTASPSRTPSPSPATVAGICIGSVSACLGIGGGTLTVPLLTRCGLPLKRAIATAAACGLPIATAGAITLLWWEWQGSGHVRWDAFAAVSAASLLAAPQGARLAHYLRATPLRLIFSVFLLVVGLRMILAE